MTKGFVIGKFFPLHRGHQHLIDVALAHSDALIVVVCDRKGDVIPAHVRAGWIQSLYPKVDVRVWADIGHDDDSRIWADYTKEKLGYAPDVVFTSEKYGDSYAKHLGARHYLVDQKRRGVHISGTKIRSNLHRSDQYLSRPVQEYFLPRIVVIGAESTGTTTLAESLAEYYHTVSVPEYGREYSQDKFMRGETTWKSDEFIHIAREQLRRENDALHRAETVLVCDTDAFATMLWHERYTGFLSPEVKKIADEVSHDLYILTGDEIPFVQDGLRDGEHIRHDMHKRFEEELEKSGRKFILVRGTHEERLKTAILAINKIVRERQNIFVRTH